MVCLFLQLVGLGNPVRFILAWIWYFNNKVIKAGSSDWWHHFARPLGLALVSLWCSLAYLLQQKYSFMTHNKNNKARCKKSFLVIKMIISICVNRNLLRVKSTKNRKWMELSKKQFFFIYMFRPKPQGSAIPSPKFCGSEPSLWFRKRSLSLLEVLPHYYSIKDDKGST